jgi:peptidyl-tRNA hydrolase, PTH1 family
MKIIIGLGNPGTEYAGTRHNTGINFVDAIYDLQITSYKDGYGWRRKKDIFVAEFPGLVLVKTAMVFMNESDKVIFEVRYLKYDLKDLYIAHDDLDIKLGEYKIQFGTGPKIHNGLLAVERALGTKEFWRIRIGIDNRMTPVDGEAYVLQRFNPEEKKIIDRVLENITHEITETITG